jgi:NADH-quinone oxidoreductase subunit F
VHLQVDYEALKQVGAIMGSGGLVVMDERTCMVDVARYFLDFTQGESCGKCLPCREGTRQMLALLNKITSGQGELADLDLLEELSLSVKDASLCGLGQTAPNPVLSTMKYFRGEYEEHIVDRRCSASVCEKLVIASCQNECPAGIDVPIYVDLVKHRKFREAFDVIYRDNPFPATCGRVCPHPCELRCRRGLLDDAVGIRELKRFACDYVYEKEELKVSPPRRRKSQHIGIIGSGPAGLTVGFYLAKLGYAATIYEAQPVAGGMMAVGIPDYRLPKGILNREIALVEAMGVEIQTNIKIGKHISIGELRQKHDALFVGVGAQKELPLDIPGEKLKGVLSGLEFLHVINLSNKKVSLRGKTVVVIGGGHTAIDAARSALRLGAKAHIVYRREMKDMPAFKDKEEIFQAQNEGVEFTFLAVPVKFLGKGDWLTGVVCQRMCLGKFDQSGRRRPVPVEGEEFIISADFVIPSVGQEPEYDGFDREIGLKISKWNTLVVDSRTLGTNIPGVFAGGDCVTGPATVVEAIGAGKRAAASIDRYLGGSGKLHDEETILREVFGPVAEPGQKMKAGLISLGQRARNFNEVECVYTEYQAITEAARCMRCDCKESEDEDAQGVKCPGCSS